MRAHLREFLELCAQTLVCPEPIVELGAFQVAGQEEISDLRPLFPGKIYIGCDMQPGAGRVATDRRSRSLPRVVVEKTSAKYGEAFERLTASRLHVDQQDEALPSR